MGFFSNIGKFFKKSVKSLSNPVKYLGDLGNALFGGNAFSDFDGDLGVFGNLGGTIQDFWKDYTGQTIAEKNLDFQREQLDYQKWLNSEQMRREDNAMVRKVNDLKNAGLNPILAANGTGASSAPLHAGPAPQLSDYSGGVREGLAGMSNLVLQAITMRKDFAQKDAQIKLLQSERAKVEAETAGIKTENKYKDDWFRLRNENADLENKLKSGTLQNNIDLVASKLSISKKEELIKNMELMLGQADYDLKKVDKEIRDLIKEGKITENQILDKKLEILTTEALQKALDYSNSEWDTAYYHGFNMPVGLNGSWLGQLTMFLGGLISSDKALLEEYFDLVSGQSDPRPRKFTRKELKELLRRPEGSNILWTQNMNKKQDYGVRRNF